MTQSAKVCFVIAPIGAPDSETRKRSDKVLKHVFAKAVDPFGYQLLRADQISEPGLITLQVLQHVLNDDLVIADLTERNPNVFYELAVRHATAKPVLHVIDASHEIPFDVSDFRTIKFDYRDLDSVEEAVRQITSQVKAIEGGAPVETPVKLAAAVERLGTDKSEDKLIIKQILDTLTELRSELRLAIDIQRSRAQVFNLGDISTEGKVITVKQSPTIEWSPLQLPNDYIFSIGPTRPKNPAEESKPEITVQPLPKPPKRGGDK